MPDKKKPKIHTDTYTHPKGYKVIEKYTDDESFHEVKTTEDRSKQGSRERRKADRRKADERTSETRRKLGDRRGHYEVTFTEPSPEVKKIWDEGGSTPLEGNVKSPGFTGDIRNKLREGDFQLPNTQAMRKAREVVRRGGEFRSKIKGKKGGLIGLGFILGNAFNAGMEAYKEKQ